MSKEIKFRARDFATGKWYIGSLNPIKGEINLPTFFSNLHVGSFDVNTLGEFTGLKDKNEISVYEGDIVKQETEGGNVLAKVEYREAFDESDEVFAGFSFRIFFEKDGDEEFDSDGEWLVSWRDNVEVIGNIWENPELLESK